MPVTFAMAALVIAIMMVPMAALVLAFAVVVAAAALVAMLMVVAAAALVAMLVSIRVERPIEAGGNRIALLLIEKGDCLRAQLGATDSVEHVVEGVRGIGAGKGDLLLLGLLERQTDVFDEVLHHEARLPIAVERLGRKGVHSAR